MRLNRLLSTARTSAIFLLAAQLTVEAGTYYVSPAGNDTNPGTEGRPFESVQAAIDAMQAGDELVVGDGFYTGQLTLKSGITLRAENPRRVIFTALEPVPSTFKKVGLIHEARVQDEVNQVFYRGQPMSWATWPSVSWQDNWDRAKKWAEATEGTGPGVLTSESFASLPPGFDGGYVFLRYGKGNSCYSRKIKSYDGTVLEWDDHNFYQQRYTGEDGPRGTAQAIKKLGENHPNHPKRSKFFLAGNRAFLDAPGEWMVEDQTLYFQAPDETSFDPTQLLIKVEDYCIDQSRRLSDVTIEGIDFWGTSIRLTDSKSIRLTNVHFNTIGGTMLYPDREKGGAEAMPIEIHGQEITIDQCLFYGAQSTALSLKGSAITVSNSVFTENNRHAHFEGKALLLEASGFFQITHNTFFNNCSDAIRLTWGKQGGMERTPQIAYNNIFNAGIYNSDVSGIYMPTGPQYFTEIHHNWIHNIHGNGCRLDLIGSHLSVHHNVYWSSKRGMSIEGYGDFNIYNNTEIHNERESSMIRNVLDRRILERAHLGVKDSRGMQEVAFPPIDDWNILNNLSAGMVDQIGPREMPVYRQNEKTWGRDRRSFLTIQDRGTIRGNRVGDLAGIFLSDRLSDLNLVPANPIVREGLASASPALTALMVTSLSNYQGAYDVGAEPGNGYWVPGSDWMPQELPVLATMAESESFAKFYHTRSVMLNLLWKNLPPGRLKTH